MAVASKLQVLHLINGLGAGGAERSLAQQLPLLRARGIDSVVVCLNRRSEGVQESVIAEGWDVRFLPPGWPGRVKGLRDIIRQATPNLVHTAIFEADLLGRVATIGTGVPVVSSLVNMSYELVRHGDPNVTHWKLAIARALDALSGRLRVRGYHAVSEAVARSNSRRLGIPGQRITVVPRARPAAWAAPTSHRSSVRETLGTPPEAFLILTVGRQEYQKGQVHLVDAFSRLAVHHPSAWLWIIGRQGNASGSLQEAVGRARGRHRILVLGHRPDVPHLLSAADIFVFPSLYEGLGGALLEAMAAGLPIVGSDIPAIREVGGDAILYSAPGDVDGLTARVAELLNDPELRASLGTAALGRFLEWPNLDDVADLMAEWYLSCAGMS